MKEPSPKACLLLFLKAPEPGEVKTRLAQAIGAEAACRLYRNFVLDLLETLSRITGAGSLDLRIFFSPPAAAQEVRKWLGSGYDYAPQEGRDLGERMKNAFLASFTRGYERVLLLGSDVPDLTGEIIKEGFDHLEGCGAVLGPARDGGYYLIGFRANAFLPAVFDHIPWSTEEVFAKTLAIFRSANCTVALLPAWRDIDTLADLRDLRERHRTGAFARSRTLLYLLSQEDALAHRPE